MTFTQDVVNVLGTSGPSLHGTSREVNCLRVHECHDVMTACNRKSRIHLVIRTYHARYHTAVCAIYVCVHMPLSLMDVHGLEKSISHMQKEWI